MWPYEYRTHLPHDIALARLRTIEIYHYFWPMKKFLTLPLAFLFCTSACLLSCGNKTSSSINPNGDSALALLMRDMHEDGLHTKQQLLNGGDIEVNVKYHELQTAEATEPEKVASQTYKSFATYYEATVQSLIESNDSNKAEAYQTMVDACMQCHEQVCPGPMRKIKRLYLSEAELASLDTK